MGRSVFLNYKASQFHFNVFGQGAGKMLLFHGFGETAEYYEVLNDSLGKIYTVYSMDFPFHGKTEWHEQKYFVRADFQTVLEMLIKQEGLSRFSLFGFSLGGKLAMTTLKMFSGRIDELFLVAPDGIWTNRYYNVAVYPGWGRMIFKTIIHRPELFFVFVKVLRKWGRLSRFLYEFTLNHMDTKPKRQRIYDVWMSARDFQPDIEEVKGILHQAGIQTHLFFGKYDQVIRPAAGDLFAEGLTKYTLTLVEGGHQLIKSSFNSHLENVLAPSGKL